jgi:mono/diheme cytochrome c family protein
MRRGWAYLIIAGVAVILVWGLWQSGAAEQRVTDTDIHAAFQRAHSVMKELRADLQAILDGFLTGDGRVIQAHADEVAKRMNVVAREYPPQPGTESEEWKALADLIEQARLLQQDAKADRYSQAYQRYTVLAGRCVACHQIRRESGQFPEPKAAQAGELPSAQPE